MSQEMNDDRAIQIMPAYEPDPRELDIFRKHFAPKETTDSEWEIFLETCRTYRLSPMRKQMYLVGRYDGQKKRMVNTPQISIGGLRALALRTGQFEGTTEPEWGDEEGVWYKLWPKSKGQYPYAARIGVYRRGFRAPVWGVAYFHEMAQKKSQNNGGGYTKFWLEMGIHMILKCALADALRGAFEEECGGVYLHEEMNQADADGVVVSIIPEPDTSDPLLNGALRETAQQKIESPQPKPIPKKSNPMNAAQLRAWVAKNNPVKDGKVLSWDDVLSAACEEVIQSGKVTLENLKSLEDELPPDICARIQRFLLSLKNTTQEKQAS